VQGYPSKKHPIQKGIIKATTAQAGHEGSLRGE
jgi:hypothetical protein